MLARQLAETGDRRVVVFEHKPHVGGHCHTERDPATGVLLHRFGAHVFHTHREDLWRYVTRFGVFHPYITRVRAITHKGVFSLPINLLTINQFFGRTFRPDEAAAFVATLSERSDGSDGSGEPRTFEEQALRTVGRALYEAFFLDYTTKQWGAHPRQLPASVFNRLPVRYSYDDNYFSDRYQGIPVDGYTAVIEAMLDHPAITVRLGERIALDAAAEFEHLFYTGAIDACFEHRLGRLRYRSLRFERLEDRGDYQGGAVITDCRLATPYTRTVEHKHLAPWEHHERTVVFREYSFAAGDTDEQYYPVRLPGDLTLLASYQALAAGYPNVTFAGRLGTYRYLDMHVVVAEAIDLAARYLARPAGPHRPHRPHGPPGR